ncbi:hypothetical protein GEV33_004929 [Tenebrio molitor]|uniref:Uncharacterized protein n=1 Tax=Tenebrio molitor TaxID=7067 RepID=A0A8J6HNT0_TENMO|nr:hypothetical protein GEV33_004929 [Tenebrio molitor]
MDSCNFKSCSTSRIPLIIVQNYTEQSVNHDEEPELHHRGVDNVQKQKSEKEGNWSSDKRQIWRRSLMGPVFVSNIRTVDHCTSGSGQDQERVCYRNRRVPGSPFKNENLQLTSHINDTGVDPSVTCGFASSMKSPPPMGNTIYNWTSANWFTFTAHVRVSRNRR